MVAGVPVVCGICGSQILASEPLHIDHVQPRALGGSNVLSNLRPVHGRCNSSRGAGRSGAPRLRYRPPHQG